MGKVIYVEMWLLQKWNSKGLIPHHLFSLLFPCSSHAVDYLCFHFLLGLVIKVLSSSLSKVHQNQIALDKLSIAFPSCLRTLVHYRLLEISVGLVSTEGYFILKQNWQSRWSFSLCFSHGHSGHTSSVFKFQKEVQIPTWLSCTEWVK